MVLLVPGGLQFNSCTHFSLACKQNCLSILCSILSDFGRRAHYILFLIWSSGKSNFLKMHDCLSGLGFLGKLLWFGAQNLMNWTSQTFSWILRSTWNFLIVLLDLGQLLWFPCQQWLNWFTKHSPGLSGSSFFRCPLCLDHVVIHLLLFYYFMLLFRDMVWLCNSDGAFPFKENVPMVRWLLSSASSKDRVL